MSRVIRKSRRIVNITKEQYRSIDLVIFAVIIAVLEWLNLKAINVWLPQVLFTVSLFLPITLLVMMRWNGYAVIHAIIAALIYCIGNGGTAAHYVIYIVGNCGILLTLVLFKAVGKKRLISKWYYVFLIVAVAYVGSELCRAIVAACFGNSFLPWLIEALAKDALSAAITVIVLLIARKQNGLFEDQNDYLLRMNEERVKSEATENNLPPIDLSDEKANAHITAVQPDTNIDTQENEEISHESEQNNG